jgi:mannose-6-phosphate isomerase-like protein (cupin superfamily)
MPSKPFVVNERQCEVERWDNPRRGTVTWRTLIGADGKLSDSLTMGVSELFEKDRVELKVHRHAQSEVYFILSGRGSVSIDQIEYALSPGDAVFIPGGALHGARCIGSEPLRLLYIFAADSFGEIKYEFPDPA